VLSPVSRILLIARNSWNSAYGGPTVLEFQLEQSEEVLLGDIQSKYRLPDVGRSREDDLWLNDVRKKMSAHFEQQVAFYEDRNQGPVSDTAAAKAAEYASAVYPLCPGSARSLSLRLAKDITARDARDLGTFVGPPDNSHIT
jgi:hypothetical protein